MSYADLLKAKGAIAKGAKTTAMWQNVFSDIAAAGTFVAGQVERSKTAWGEYEKGYEQISGKKADISGESWLKRTFGKPEGEVDIGGKKYNMEDLRNVGGILSSDIAPLISPDILTAWANKTASGTLIPEEKSKKHQKKVETIEEEQEIMQTAGEKKNDILGIDPSFLPDWHKDLYSVRRDKDALINDERRTKVKHIRPASRGRGGLGH